jgi:hypothetical protein
MRSGLKQAFAFPLPHIDREQFIQIIRAAKRHLATEWLPK